MPIKVTCPKCQGVLHAPDDAGGKKGKCPTCGTVLSIPAEAPKVSPAASPAPPENPFRASDEPLRATAAPPAEDTRRSSFGAGPPPREEPVARKATGRVPPPAFAPPADARKADDPFARPARPVIPAADVSDATIRAWRRARRGLWWVGLALFLFLLPILGLAGIAIAETFGTQIPDQDPGYLQLEGLRSSDEIRAAVVAGPVLLGLLVLTLGRFGLTNAPRTSFAKGLAMWSALATLLVLLGVIAAAAPVVAQIATGFAPHGFLPADSTEGQLQRIGLAVAGVFLILAELWFIVALGRVGAALHDRRLAGRGTRFLVYVGILAVIGLVVGVVALEDRTAAASQDQVRKLGDDRLKVYSADRPIASALYVPELREQWNEHVVPQWNKLGDARPAVEAGLLGLAGLIVWFWYVRLVTAGRRAIRGWLEANAPVA